jgi:hypothetical protein
MLLHQAQACEGRRDDMGVEMVTGARGVDYPHARTWHGSLDAAPDLGWIHHGSVATRAARAEQGASPWVG